MLYVVQRGDSLDRIAQTHGVSVARLRSDNGLPPDQPLVPGQVLVVLRPRRTYRVRPGDTLFGIAGAAGVTVLQLLRENPTLSPDRPLDPGEELALGLEGEQALPLWVNGYSYPHVDPTVLDRALPFLTDLSVFSYEFREDGRLVVPPAARLLSQGRAFGTGLLLVLSSLAENGTFSPDHVSRFLASEARQEAVLGEMLPRLLEEGCRGLDVDFEFIPPQDRPAFLAFLGKARQRLHAHGLALHVALAPKTRADQRGLLYEAHDYAVVGQLADGVLLMTYEWGYAAGTPMAVAPLPQVAQVLDYAVTEIPPWKLWMGIPNYGYDWTLPQAPGRRAALVGNQEAVTLAARVGAEITFDPVAQAPTFAYRQAGQAHRVWFEDARSIQAKLRLAAARGLRGVSYWNLLRPFAQNWALLSQYQLPAER